VAVDARHLARERALELLYEAATKGERATDVLASLPVAPDPLVVALVTDAEATREVADSLIASVSTDWPLERMALLDRLVMVLAIGELLGATPPPDAVVLDEAVELAKTYSTEASPRFVNGILAAVLPSLPRAPRDRSPDGSPDESPDALSDGSPDPTA
jgi:transcription antitermination protein NusB